MDMDDDYRLRNVFCADTRSRAVYEFFCDVITFETTYLTNRYDMSFTLFVGVIMVSNDDTSIFVWLFNS
jgi:hypothetical protein